MPSPAQRLSRSREQLRLSLLERSRAQSDGEPRHHGGASKTWADALLPGMAGLVRHWWSGHPLRATAGMAAGVATLVLQPLVMRHPWAMAASAATLGGALAWSRPWRWTLKPALLAGVVPQLMLALFRASANRSPSRPAP